MPEKEWEWGPPCSSNDKMETPAQIRLAQSSTQGIRSDAWISVSKSQSVYGGFRGMRDAAAGRFHSTILQDADDANAGYAIQKVVQRRCTPSLSWHDFLILEQIPRWLGLRQICSRAKTSGSNLFGGVSSGHGFNRPPVQLGRPYCLWVLGHSP